ncbi:twin-arginine translocase TatA/TatE family subunit [Acanthopleuribacter pedis]|uniref:Sec-independent protein translocase protein TatA n=2 Tax=Acanthopleuribacter pedis TaxID=442870 RepID=A0A8J7U566_9BACT|nr:twin-arginine translocase TatA/TatE family subunit [Acanthopleuribacter pedis]
MIGPWEIGLIVLVVIVLFGAKKLPQLGQGLGAGIRNFKDAVSGQEEEKKIDPGKPEAKPEE